MPRQALREFAELFPRVRKRTQSAGLDWDWNWEPCGPFPYEIYFGKP